MSKQSLLKNRKESSNGMLEQLNRFSTLSLEQKILLSERRIDEWYRYYNGQVYISFSGGKDSTILLSIVRNLFPEVPAVFIDTGLEYPEIREFIKSVDNVTWLKPAMSFKKVIETYGYPVISKKQARFISDIQRADGQNEATVNLRLTGETRAGTHLKSMMISKKWLKLIYADFKVSDKCCDYLKKDPLKKYQKESGRMPITGVMASESQRRRIEYLNTGCNFFSEKNPMSKPLSFWTESDIWEYIQTRNIKYSSIYDMGEDRTGCMFCMFGVHLEKGTNRFQRMRVTHPKQYDYCINKLGCGKVLDFIGVNYE